MVEIETVKCEGCLRANEGGREPTSTKNLDVMRNDTICATIAEVNRHMVDA